MFVTPGYAEESAPAEGEAHTAEGQANGAHTEQSGGGHEGGGSFPPFDSTYYPSQLLWLAITFGLFYLFLKRVVLPRIGGILEVRRDRIAQDLDQAARMKEEADAAVAAYEQELAEARSKAGGIAQEARDSAKRDADTERKRVEAELEKKLADAEQRIAGIKQGALKEVGSIAEETASAIVERLTGAGADKAAVSAAVANAKG
ncbi:MAG: F0F1 ATP synthase subunit B [Rhizobiaceae bacterium]|nr:F0F1 ATP synthase subunit B [Rhizobiaceae bacterium]